MAAVFLAVSSLLVTLMMLLFFWRYCPERKDKILACAVFVLLFTLSGVVSSFGIFQDFSDFPPPLMKFLISLFIVTLLASFSPWGQRLAMSAPFSALIGLQAFRVLPELFLVLGYNEQLFPIQMTLHGRNLDIVTAVISILILVAWRFVKNPRPLAIFHTIVGLGLLINVVGTAILSMPSPFRAFLDEPSTAIVGTFPYTWLPAIHVVTALLLHCLTIRKLFAVRG